MAERNWKAYNEKLVRRGELYLSLDFLKNWDNELEKMNDGKRGRPFEYPGQFIQFLMFIHVMFLLPYRQLEGFLRKLSQLVPEVKVTDYTNIFRRGTILEVSLADTITQTSDDVVIAVDSTGIKVSNRGEWMREKWRKHRGWIKVHIAVDIKTKEIVALEITDEKIGDNQVFGNLIDKAENNVGRIKRILADGMYDTKEDFSMLEEKNIEPGIKIRKNASTKARGSPCRAKHVREYKKLGYDKWKEKYGYGYRWSSESAFSSVKRITGEHVTSHTRRNMFREVALKFVFYNLLLNIA